MELLYTGVHEVREAQRLDSMYRRYRKSTPKRCWWAVRRVLLFSSLCYLFWPKPFRMLK